MSNAEDRYRDADELARDLEEDNRRREEVRALELDRLKRLHAQEASQDRRVAQHTRAMRVVRRLQWQREPAQVRRSMAWFTFVFALIPLIGALLVWLTVADLIVRQGGAPWAGHALGLGYLCAFGVALGWYARSCWAQEPPPWAPVASAWVLLLAPVAVLVAAALAGWLDWTFLAVVLPVFLLLGWSAIFMCRELPRQVRRIEAKSET